MGMIPGLHRLTDRAPPDNSWRQFLDRIRDAAFDRSLSVQRFAERVHDAAEQPFADRHLQQPTRRADLCAFLETGVVAEDDRPDLGLVQVQRQAGDAAAEVEHLVEHDVAKSFDLGHAVADLADRADRLSGGGRFGAGNLRLDFVQQVNH